MHHFTAQIYKTGINWCVDVPERITKKLVAVKGYIRIKGKINAFDFTTSLVPVKDAPYRLFVNAAMMKGGKTALGEVAKFSIEQNETKVEKEYAQPKLLLAALKKENLSDEFNSLTPSRKKDILKYLSYIKTEETLNKNIAKLILQLKSKSKNVRIP